jgi:N-acetylglutamate synthase-like GNAT family acetyltransferase
MAAIKALIKQVGINPMGLEWPRFVVAEDAQGQFIGCGQVKPHRDGSRELASIAVVKGWRRRGVARAIIEHLQQQYGVPLWLTCMNRLTPFYEQYGFRETAVPQQMPPYFRQARRFFSLYKALARVEGQLAVMVWELETVPAHIENRHEKN